MGGVRTRRQFHYDNRHAGSKRGSSDERGSSGELVSYSDDVLDVASLADLASTISLRGEAAVLAAVNAPAVGRMKPVVAMIQAEQDAIIRAPANIPLIVQGGPGTGKTVVALHRAAYLLYDQREELSDRGVLVVGPTKRFLRYVSNVLPSLGETGVVSATPAELFPARRGQAEVVAAARLKGTVTMVAFIAKAVQDRQRRPRTPLSVYYGSRRVVLTTRLCDEIFQRARRAATHNDGAEVFRSGIIEALVDAVYDPAFFSLEDATESFMENVEVRQYLLAHWPTLTPEQCLNDVFGSGALLESARRTAGLTRTEAALLARPRSRERALQSRAWTDADTPLLDELENQLGQLAKELTESERSRERDVENEFELAQAIDRAHVELDESGNEVSMDRVPGTLDLEEVGAGQFRSSGVASLDSLTEDETADDASESTGPVDPGTLVDRFQGDRAAMVGDVDPTELVPEIVDDFFSEDVSVVDLAIGERSFRFGHVIVDEAQDLSAMQWRMIVRRAEPGAITAVGDLAQRTIGTAYRWKELLPALGPVVEATLSINYRSPVEVLAPAGEVLEQYAPHLSMPTAIRSGGIPFRHRKLASIAGGVADVLSELTRSQAAEGTDRSLGLIWPEGLNVDDEAAILQLGSGPPLRGYQVISVRAEEARGLEFDAVVVIAPERFSTQPGGLALLFVALTRATQWSASISTVTNQCDT